MLEKVLYKLGEGLRKHKENIQNQELLLSLGHRLSFGPGDFHGYIPTVICERSKLQNRFKTVYYRIVERLLPEVYYKI